MYHNTFIYIQHHCRASFFSSLIIMSDLRNECIPYKVEIIITYVNLHVSPSKNNFKLIHLP